LIENCIIYIIGKFDDGSSSPSIQSKKRHSSAIEGRNKILKTEKYLKNGINNNKNYYFFFYKCMFLNKMFKMLREIFE